MSDFNKTIATNVRYYRKKAKLTQKALGDLVGSSPFAVSRWESGDAIPTAVDMALICDALDVDPALVMGLDDSFSEDTETDRILLARYHSAPDHVRQAIDALLKLEGT